MSEFAVSRPIPVASIPAAGIEREIVATEKEREALAGAYGLLAVNSLTATVAATPRAGGIIEVEGRVQAEIVQACVVTLDPVVQTIDEPILARYATAGSGVARGAAGAEAGEGAEDPPEVLSGAGLDLGAIAVEHFVLAIDPYPRAPGAELPRGAAGENQPDSPFAKLAALRGRLPDRG